MLLLRAGWGAVTSHHAPTLTNLPPCIKIFPGKTLTAHQRFTINVYIKNDLCWIKIRPLFFLIWLHFCLHIVLVCLIFLVYKYCRNCYYIFKNENPGNYSFHTFAFYHIIHLVNTQNLIQCMSINFICISIKNFMSNYIV